MFLPLVVLGQIRWGGGPSANPVSDVCGLPSRISGETPVWEVRLGTHQYSVPTFQGGRLYLGCNDSAVGREGYVSDGGGVLICLDFESGRRIWEYVVPKYQEGGRYPYYFDRWDCGICSGPLVVDGRVYFADNRSRVVCLDSSGKEIWTFDMLKMCDTAPHDTIAVTLAYADGLLVVGTCNGVEVNHRNKARPEAPTLIVLSAETGKMVAHDNEKIGHDVLHGNWCSPVIAEIEGRKAVFYGGGDGFIYALEFPSLKRIWKTDANPVHFRRDENGNARLYSRWPDKRPDGPCEPVGVPVIVNGKVYSAIGQSPVYGPGKGCLSCYDAATGKVVWRTEKIDRTLLTPAVSGGILYIGDAAGRFHAFDSETGETLWTDELNGPARYGNPFVADGKVYIGTERGEFRIYQAGPIRKLLDAIKLPSPAMQCIAADGKLVVPMQNRIAVWKK